MNIESMVSEALRKIDSMSADQFQNKLIEAGYTPVRKADVYMCDALILNREYAEETIRYVGNVALVNVEDRGFNVDLDEDSMFLHAA